MGDAEERLRTLMSYVGIKGTWFGSHSRFSRVRRSSLACRIQYLRSFIAIAVVDIQCKVIISTHFHKIVTRFIQAGTDDIVESRIVGVYSLIKPVESLTVSLGS